MIAKIVRRLAVLGILVSTAGSAYAQEAILSGVITDTTGGVLPGVTVTALHEATGNRFVGVTDDRGAYRIPARIGVVGQGSGAMAAYKRG